MSLKNRIIAACPLISVLIFLVLGFADEFGLASHGLWNPGWVVFFLTPVMSALLNMHRVRYLITLTVTILYLVIGFMGYWHPGWIIFLLIPILNILMAPRGNAFRFVSQKFHINNNSNDNDNRNE